ncbi:MAG TPA: hypothetical protein VH329_05375, partial [Solirubrobacterales bacterium]
METWVSGADGTGFGIEHLPLGVLRAGSEPPRPAVRIGDRGLLLAPLAAAGLLDAAEGARAEALREVLQAPSLNPLLELGRPSWSGLRTRLTELLAAGNSELADAGLSGALVPLDEAEALLP